jgi:hypothetical protein
MDDGIVLTKLFDWRSMLLHRHAGDQMKVMRTGLQVSVVVMVTPTLGALWSYVT